MKFLSSKIQPAVFLALGFSLFLTNARGSVMTFETATPGSMLTASYEENGIRLTVVSGHYDIWQCGQQGFTFPPCNGIVAGIDEALTGPAIVRIELSNGALFNLNGITILSAGPDDWLGASNGVNLRFSNGPVMPSLGAFQGIRYIELQSRSLLPGFVFDNIEMAEIPEPSALTLVILGLMLVAPQYFSSRK